MISARKGRRQTLYEPELFNIYGHHFGRFQGASFSARQSDQISDYNLAALEKLLTSNTALTANTHNATPMESASSERGTQNSVAKSGQKTSRHGDSPKLTTLQFLNALESQMLQETFASRVDYFTLHMRSYKMIEDIQGLMQRRPVGPIGPIFVMEEYDLPNVVIRMLGYVIREDTIVKDLAKMDPGGAPHKVLFSDIAEVLNKYIETEGDSEVERIKSISNVYQGLDMENLPV